MDTSIAATGLTLVGVDKHFGEAHILSDVSLHVPAGSICALLGPSGSGKTTLLRVIAGLETAEAGAAVLDGVTLFDAPAQEWISPEHRQVGMVFQDWAIFPHLSVGKNIAFGLGRHDHAGRVAEVLAMVGLTGFDDRMPATLSGGQLQRVALARALAPRPKALLLDEPFSNLDVALRVRVRSDLHRLLSDAGVTTVFVTHDQEEAFVLGDQVVVMREGRTLQHASPHELYDAPADAWTAAFVGDVNLLDGAGRGAQVHTVLGSMPARAHRAGPVQVVVRPEALSIEQGDDAVVELVEFFGHDTMIDCRLRDGTLLHARVRNAGWRRGDRVNVRYIGGPVVTFAVTEPVSSGLEGSTTDQADRARD